MEGFKNRIALYQKQLAGREIVKRSSIELSNSSAEGPNILQNQQHNRTKTI